MFKFLTAGLLTKTNLNFNIGHIGYLSALGKLRSFSYLATYHLIQKVLVYILKCRCYYLREPFNILVKL